MKCLLGNTRACSQGHLRLILKQRIKSSLLWAQSLSIYLGMNLFMVSNNEQISTHHSAAVQSDWHTMKHLLDLHRACTALGLPPHDCNAEQPLIQNVKNETPYITKLCNVFFFFFNVYMRFVYSAVYGGKKLLDRNKIE